MAVTTTDTPAPTSAPKGAATRKPGRQPADRKPKAAAKPRKPTVTTRDDGMEVTYRGVTVFVATEALNDYELLEDAAAEDMSRLPSVLRRLVGDEGHDQVKEACRDPESGRVRLDGERSVSEWVAEVFEAINPS